jgi:hypothetical protein
MAKKYSVNMEGDRVVSVEVDGVRYSNAGQIPDADDRARMEMLLFGVSDLETEMPTGKPSALPRVLTALFLSIAVLMLAIAGLTGVTTRRALAREQSAPGRVVELVVRPDAKGSEFYYPLVEFYLPNGSRQTAQVTEGNWPAAYEKGQAVTVLYDIQEPANARIASTSSTIGRWTLTIIAGILGLAFLAATLFATWVFRSTPAEPAGF